MKQQTPSYTPLQLYSLNATTRVLPLAQTVVGITKSLVMVNMKNNKIKITQPKDVATVAKTNFVVIGVHTVLGIDSDFVVNEILGLSSSVHQFRVEKVERPVADCWMGSVFEYYDVIITTDQYFTIMLRQNRDCYITKLVGTTIINATDLNMAYLSPFEVLSFNTTAVTDPFIQNYYATTYMFEYMYQFAQLMLIPASMCNKYFIAHDWAVLRGGQGILNVSQSDELLVSKYFSNKMVIDRSSFNQAIVKLQTNLTMPFYSFLNIETDVVVSQTRSQTLFPSTCYSCTTSQCIWDDANNPVPAVLDANSIAASASMFCIIIIYWPAIIIFRNRDVIKRRLFLPYIQVVSLFVQLIQISQLQKVCYMMEEMIIYSITIVFITAYGVIAVRFVFLRFIYMILKQCKTETQVALVKRLASRSFAMILAVVVGTILGIIVAIVVPLSIFNKVSMSFGSLSKLSKGILYV